MTIFLLSWPRFAASRMYWKSCCIYEILKLAAFKGGLSKWAWNSFPRWCTRLELLGFHSQTLGSQQCAVVHDRARDAEGFLSAAAVPTLAIIQLLARWSAASPNNGGFRKLADRRAAECLLEGILDSDSGMCDRRLHIVLTAEVKVWWLAGAPPGSFALPLSGCQASLEPWKALMQPPNIAPSLAEDWFRSCNLANCGSQVHLSKLLRMALFERSSAPFASQLLFQVAQWVELSVYRALRGKCEPHGVRLKAGYQSIMHAIDKPASLNGLLLKYVMGGVRASESWVTLSMASDKASVCGLSLDAGAFAWPDNRCAVVVPQVASGIRAISGAELELGTAGLFGCCWSIRLAGVYRPPRVLFGVRGIHQRAPSRWCIRVSLRFQCAAYTPALSEHVLPLAHNISLGWRRPYSACQTGGKALPRPREGREAWQGGDPSHQRPLRLAGAQGAGTRSAARSGWRARTTWYPSALASMASPPSCRRRAPSSSPPPPPNWARWPHLKLISDQGPGAVAGMFVLEHKVEAQANITEWWDESQGLHNDVIGEYMSFQLLPFVLLTMCIQNLPPAAGARGRQHGVPGARAGQLRLLRHAFVSYAPAACGRL